MALPELPPARAHSGGKTVKPRRDNDQKRGGERTEEPRARKTSSEVEGGLCDLHKASATHGLLRESQRVPACSYHTAVPPRGSASELKQTTPHHCSCTTGPLPGEGQETQTRLCLNEEGRGNYTASVNSALALRGKSCPAEPRFPSSSKCQVGLFAKVR